MNIFGFLGIVAAVASALFLMTGCLTAADRSTPLVGTWSSAWDTLVFNADGRFQITWSYGEGGQMSGTFTVRRDDIFLTPQGGQTFRGTHYVVGDNLHISIPGWQWIGGILSRHVYDGPLVGTWGNPSDTLVLNADGTFRMTWSYGEGGQMSGTFTASDGDILLTPRGRNTYTGTFYIIDEDAIRISVPGWQWNDARLLRAR